MEESFRAHKFRKVKGSAEGIPIDESFRAHTPSGNNILCFVNVPVGFFMKVYGQY